MGTRVHQGPTFTATTLDFTRSTLAARVRTPKEQSPASHLQTRDDRRQRLQVRVVPRDASAPGRRELYTSVHLRVITRHARCMQRAEFVVRRFAALTGLLSAEKVPAYAETGGG